MEYITPLIPNAIKSIPVHMISQTIEAGIGTACFGLVDGMVVFTICLYHIQEDFDGQRRAERTFQIIIVVFGIVGFIWGYVCQQFSQTMYILIAGFALSCLLTLPPWPMYRRKPLKWQKVQKVSPVQSGGDADSSSQKSKKKK